MDQTPESNPGAAKVSDLRIGQQMTKNLNPLFRRILELKRQNTQYPALQPRTHRP